MKFPPSEFLGAITGPDGRGYSLDFLGEDEGAAVLTGPWPVGAGRQLSLPEAHREPAVDPCDARRKLLAWLAAHGWSTDAEL